MMIDLGCKTGQGYLMHRDQIFWKPLKQRNYKIGQAYTKAEHQKGAEEIVLTQIKQDFITPVNAIFDYVDMAEKALIDAALESTDEIE